MTVLFTLIFLQLVSNTYGETTKPNIILLVLDDWGFNDVTWHEHSDMEMRFLAKHIEEEALIIDTHYAYPLCSITRSALMTGRYPIRFGLQSSVIENGYKFGLSIFEQIIPTDFHKLGYQTAAIGKWHLGFHRPDLTPLERDFDKYHGSLSPMLHYYSHDYTIEDTDYTGYDLRIDNRIVNKDDNKYLTFWERDQFINVVSDFVEDSDDYTPFFIYLAMHAGHNPFEAPDECISPYLEKLDLTSSCLSSFDTLQQVAFDYCGEFRVGMEAECTCASRALHKMIKHLKDLEIWDDTLIIGLSDNGASLFAGDNYPLRSGKKYLYEGGVRTPAFVTGGYLNEDRRGTMFESSTVVHVTDWYPTILSAAGMSDDKIFDRDRQFDGKNLWNAIQYNEIDHELSSTKREFLYNIDSYQCDTDKVCGAYRYGQYKLIWAPNVKDQNAFWTSTFAINTHDDGHDDYLSCGDIPSDVQSSVNDDATFPCSDAPCLFDIVNDPCEYHDLVGKPKHKLLYHYMYNMLLAYSEVETTPLKGIYTEFDPDADTVNFDGVWTPWKNAYGDNDETEFEQYLILPRVKSDVDNEVNVQYADTHVSSSDYYQLAQVFKKKYIKAQNSAKKEFESTLWWLSVCVVALVAFGSICVFIKWYQYCVHGVTHPIMEQEEQWYAQEKASLHAEFLAEMDREETETKPLLGNKVEPRPRTVPMQYAYSSP